MRRLVSLALVMSLFPSRPSRWTENWGGRVSDRWIPVTRPFYNHISGLLFMQCQSCGLISMQKWDVRHSIYVEAKVRGSPALGSSTRNYWAGLALYNNDGWDNNYLELAAQNGVSPFGVRDGNSVVSLADGIGNVFETSTPAQWHTFRLLYLPGGYYYVSYDQAPWGSVVGTIGRLTQNASIFVLCVSVGPYTPNDGSAAHCEFGPITVYGHPT